MFLLDETCKLKVPLSKVTLGILLQHLAWVFAPLGTEVHEFGKQLCSGGVEEGPSEPIPSEPVGKVHRAAQEPHLQGRA